MAHPHAGLRQGKVERSRVSRITSGYAKGGGVIDPSTSAKKSLKKAGLSTKILDRVEGDKPKQRMDRPGRARGGRAPKSAKTVVNVITGGGAPAAGAAPPMPMPPPGGPPPMGVAGLAGKPPMMPPGAGGPPPGGMAPGPMPMRKKGGRVNSGTEVFNKSRKEAGEDPVTHFKGKNDLDQMNRPRVVTFMAGGRVKGPTEHKNGVAKATKLPGGAGGGEGRLKKAAMAKRK